MVLQIFISTLIFRYSCSPQNNEEKINIYLMIHEKKATYLSECNSFSIFMYMYILDHDNSLGYMKQLRHTSWCKLGTISGAVSIHALASECFSGNQWRGALLIGTLSRHAVFGIEGTTDTNNSYMVNDANVFLVHVELEKVGELALLSG